MAILSAMTQSGAVEGVPCRNASFTIFKGIPYAKPPVGELRWKAPVDAEPWEGIRKCDAFPPASIQKNRTPGEFYQIEFFPDEVEMSEDCLYLNIWTPSADGTERLPVMMWIHGGGYIQGYGHEMEFDGEAFCKQGAILVTINYRLGVLGFLAHPELTAESPDHASGNYGILDQIQALRWIRSNIAAFGGDPGNVTIFGQSAGGGSVQSILCSPLAEGLFHRVIVQSSGGFDWPDYTLRQAEKVGMELCREAGRSLEELKALPELALLKATDAALYRVKAGPPGLKMVPVIDGYLLKENPGKCIRAGRHPDIPYMTGSVAGDGWLFSGLSGGSGLSPAQEARLKKAALKPPVTWAEIHVKLGRKPLYLYYFDRDMPGKDQPGAFHSSELWYVFGTLDQCWRPMEEADYRISEVMTGYWVNFAKHGAPNSEELPEWPPFTDRAPLTLVISEKGIQASDLR